MPAITSEIFGAIWPIFSFSWSVPLLVKKDWHGAPAGSEAVRFAQVPMIVLNPRSLRSSRQRQGGHRLEGHSGPQFEVDL
ncbi:hypothetical protein [Streptomyces sp. CA-106131]|uniref:hypothetical protein n=1 Tax=Streptomyces sp. CA-106131 TaxID=3240045 RepID=UPI003D8CA88F